MTDNVLLTMCSARLSELASKALGQQSPWLGVEAGHWARPVTVDRELEEDLAGEVWGLFDHAARYTFPELESSFHFVELSCFKRYRNAGCAPHTDTETIGQRGRLLSTSIGMTPPGSLGEGVFMPGAANLGVGEAVIFPSGATHYVQPTSTERIVLVARVLDSSGYVSGRALWPRKGKPKVCARVTKVKGMK